MTTALIDGDVFAYRIAASSETLIEWPNGTTTFEADLGEAKRTLDELLTKLGDDLGAKKTLVAITEGRCFRYDVLPSYKHNRKEVRRPILLRDLKQHLVDTWAAKTKPKLEADDVLGIWATLPALKGRKVVVSVDKDFKQIPGFLWNPDRSEFPVRISEEQADHWHMMQTLMGDATDGYAGCPGVGPEKARDFLSWGRRFTAYEHTFKSGPRKGASETRWSFSDGGRPWDVITALYARAGLTDADALQQARVARICRAADFDTNTQEPILWTPPSRNP